MQERAGLAGWIRNYLVLGALWCFIINVHAAVTGAPSALIAASGPSTGMAKAIDVAQVLLGQIVLWPLDLWSRILRPIFG
ncbi:MAG: hypothetical protein ACRENJ_07690 [Candidatus Eiseniibacteriota bacterium]